jgi:hypothetical protein
LLVVVAEIDAEDVLELAAIEDQQSVETLPPDAADPALDVRLRVQRLERCPDHPHPLTVEEDVEGMADFASRSWIKIPGG